MADRVCGECGHWSLPDFFTTAGVVVRRTMLCDVDNGIYEDSDPACENFISRDCPGFKPRKESSDA